jgi:acetyl-CoA carboxylase, biotin carboxylase subunit
VHLFDRDCSVQRRHQKVVEESPSPHLPEAALRGLCETALAGARSVNYSSAGTFEFLVDQNHDFYFLEMNTRLQVEHPITELCTGVDIVRDMLTIAAGEPLGYSQGDISRRGAAIEVRLYAEDPNRNFMPSPGRVEYLSVPEGPGIRHDSGVCAGYTMGFDYDAMLAKLCVWAPTRPRAVERLRRALGEYDIRGLTTNLEFLKRLVDVPAFVEGKYDTGFIDRHRSLLLDAPDAWGPGRAGTAAHSPPDERMAAAALAVVLGSADGAAGSVVEMTPGARAPLQHAASAWREAHRRRRLGL